MPLVFLSAHKADAAWLTLVRRHLHPYASRGVTTWSPSDIPDGDPVKMAMQAAIAEASVVVLLVTPYFLAEDFSVGSDLHGLVSAAVARNLRILWLPVSASAYIVTDVSEYQPLHDARRPLDGLSAAEQASALVDVGERLLALLLPGREGLTRPPPVPPIEDLYLATLPGTSEETSRTMIRLAKAMALRDSMRSQGKDTSAVDKHIYELRRLLRRGHPLRVGDTLSRDRYILQQVLGTGDIATVWLAGDRLESSQVALKVLHPQFASVTGRRDRFLRGAQAMHQLHHDGIVRIVDPHEEDLDHVYFIMGYVEGSNLHDAVQAGQIAPDIGVAIVLRIGEALSFAHRHNLVHRDVKPSNILLDRAQRPYIGDFDLFIADAAAGGMGAGAFAAPELFDPNLHVDARADVFGLGMTAVFALTGKTPPRDAVRAETELDEFLLLPAAVRAVLTQAIAWRREQRFDNVSTFCRALQSAWFGHDRAPPPLAPPIVARQPDAPPVVITAPYVTTPPVVDQLPMRSDSPGPPDTAPGGTPSPLFVPEPITALTLTPDPLVTPPPSVVAEPINPILPIISPPDTIVTQPPEWISTPPLATSPSSRRRIPLVAALIAAASLLIVGLVYLSPLFSQGPVISDPTATTVTVSGVSMTSTDATTGTSTLDPPPSKPDLTREPAVKPQEPAVDLRATAKKACTDDLVSFARTCGALQATVGSGDDLGVAVVIDPRGKASITGKRNATMFGAALTCIQDRIARRRYASFPGDAIRFERNLLLKP